MSTAIEIKLPFPPSQNNLFASGRGGKRFIAPRYAKWRRQAEQLIMVSRAREFGVPVSITVTLHAPDQRPRDADNHVKAIADSLVRMRVIAGDSQKHVRSTTARWGERIPGGLAIVRIEPA